MGDNIESDAVAVSSTRVADTSAMPGHSSELLGLFPQQPGVGQTEVAGGRAPPEINLLRSSPRNPATAALSAVRAALDKAHGEGSVRGGRKSRVMHASCSRAGSSSSAGTQARARNRTLYTDPREQLRQYELRVAAAAARVHALAGQSQVQAEVQAETQADGPDQQLYEYAYEYEYDYDDTDDDDEDKEKEAHKGLILEVMREMSLDAVPVMQRIDAGAGPASRTEEDRRAARMSDYDFSRPLGSQYVQLERAERAAAVATSAPRLSDSSTWIAGESRPMGSFMAGYATHGPVDYAHEVSRSLSRLSLASAGDPSDDDGAHVELPDSAISVVKAVVASSGAGARDVVLGAGGSGSVWETAAGPTGEPTGEPSSFIVVRLTLFVVRKSQWIHIGVRFRRDGAAVALEATAQSPTDAGSGSVVGHFSLAPFGEQWFRVPAERVSRSGYLRLDFSGHHGSDVDADGNAGHAVTMLRIVGDQAAA